MSADFQDIQRQFAAQIRDPDSRSSVLDNIEARRLKIYQDLFFKNIESFAASGFPVFRSLFDDDSWLLLVREFMIIHRASSPYFLEISQEFMAFVKGYQGAIKLPAFSDELMHYEWVELALDVADDDMDGEYIEADRSAANCALCLSPVAWPLRYEFPVHHISRDFRPEEPADAPVFLLVFRDRTDKVRFVEINAAIFQLLSLIKESPGARVNHYVNVLAQQMGVANSESLLTFAIQLLDNFSADGIILAR